MSGSSSTMRIRGVMRFNSMMLCDSARRHRAQSRSNAAGASHPQEASDADSRCKQQEWLTRSLICPSLSSATARFDKRVDTISNAVANRPHLGHGKALWVADGPVFALQARYIGTLVTASHRDQQRCAARKVVGEPSWLSVGKVYSD